MATLTAGDLEVAFVPEAGMVCCSLRHRGAELLGQRGGLAAYVAERRTMGIPLLYPWANRLSRWRFPVAGRQVAIDPEATPLRTDDNGLPMHGLLSGVKGWVVEHQAREVLRARFDFGADRTLLAAFPFPHELWLEATLGPSELTVATTVRAGEAGLPIAFGFHPYLRLPGVERSRWRVEIPVRERLVLSPSKLPTGRRTAVQVTSGELGARTFDDAYVAPAGGAPFALEGPGRRIEMAFDAGYPYAQVFAPPDDPVIAFEPMTAPADALVTGEAPVLAPGERFTAGFSVRVS
jgi:aldose 1-epimerase